MKIRMIVFQIYKIGTNPTTNTGFLSATALTVRNHYPNQLRLVCMHSLFLRGILKALQVACPFRLGQDYRPMCCNYRIAVCVYSNYCIVRRYIEILALLHNSLCLLNFLPAPIHNVVRFQIEISLCPHYA